MSKRTNIMGTSSTHADNCPTDNVKVRRSSPPDTFSIGVSDQVGHTTTLYLNSEQIKHIRDQHMLIESADGPTTRPDAERLATEANTCHMIHAAMTADLNLALSPDSIKDEWCLDIQSNGYDSVHVWFTTSQLIEIADLIGRNVKKRSRFPLEGERVGDQPVKMNMKTGTAEMAMDTETLTIHTLDEAVTVSVNEDCYVAQPFRIMGEPATTREAAAVAYAIVHTLQNGRIDTTAVTQVKKWLAGIATHGEHASLQTGEIPF